jgi:hypothetical protein
MKALERDRSKRYATAEEFCTDLENYRGRRFSGYGNEKLAALIREYACRWENDREVRDKTPSLYGAPQPQPEKKRLITDSLPAPNRLRSFAILAGLTLIAFLSFWLFSSRIPKAVGRQAPLPTGRQSAIEIAGDHGTYVFLDDRLLGRAPLSATFSTGKKRRQLILAHPGTVPYTRGATLAPGKIKRIDADRKLQPGTGALSFDPPPSEILSIDGRERPLDEGEIDLPAGVHRISWEREGRCFERILFIQPGAVARLNLL